MKKNNSSRILHRMYKLTLKQRTDLETHVKQTRDITTRNRLCVILGYDDGFSIEELSKALRISTGTISNYLEQYHSKGKTENDAKGGGQDKLSQEQSKSLLKHLTEITYLYVKEICSYALKQFGVSYSRSGMTFWLKAHGFTYKKPKKVPGKLNEGLLALQEYFKATYRALKTKLSPRDAIFFGDAVHPDHQSQGACGWMLKGDLKTLHTTGKQRRLHYAGAINLENMSIVAQEYKKIDAESMSNFLRTLRASTDAPTIHLILDNGRAHKNKTVEKLASELNIKIHYLPPYSPNLNPIERLWKIMREMKLYNRYYEQFDDFCRAIRSFFTEDIPKISEILAARINDDFQELKLNPIRRAY